MCNSCVICDTHCCFFFFFNDTATTEIYTLSLHDALPICGAGDGGGAFGVCAAGTAERAGAELLACQCADRKSTRLNSSHLVISYAVFCLKKKKTKHTITVTTLNDRPYICIALARQHTILHCCCSLSHILSI